MGSSIHIADGLTITDARQFIDEEALRIPKKEDEKPKLDNVIEEDSNPKKSQLDFEDDDDEEDYKAPTHQKKPKAGLKCKTKKPVQLAQNVSTSISASQVRNELSNSNNQSAMISFQNHLPR